MVAFHINKRLSHILLLVTFCSYGASTAEFPKLGSADSRGSATTAQGVREIVAKNK